MPGALTVDNDCKRFFVMAHIAVGVPSNAPHQSGYKEVWGVDKWEDGGKINHTHASFLRAILDKNEKNIVFEIYGDLNKEYLFNVGKGWGFTGVGISGRGKNSPGFQRVLLPADASNVKDIEAYRIKTGCTFKFDHSFKKDYGFTDGITAASVTKSLADPALKNKRTKNRAPTYANKKEFDFNSSQWLKEVRTGQGGCEPVDFHRRRRRRKGENPDSEYLAGDGGIAAQNILTPFSLVVGVLTAGGLGFFAVRWVRRPRFVEIARDAEEPFASE